MQTLLQILLTGIGATALLDLWALARRRLSGAPLPDYGLVGRWFGHMRRGRFRHAAIAEAPPLPRERLIGWTAHYFIGVAFAGLVPALWGSAWLAQPTPGPALAVGLGTVLAPWLLMQPGMGAGLAARRTRDPAAVRRQNLVSHAVFGLGLYAAAWVLARA